MRLLPTVINWVCTALFLAAVCTPAFAQELTSDDKATEVDDGPTDPMTLLMDFELNERLVVEAAAKLKTTIQQVPAVITVITAKEIRDRGYRTLNDVLQTIPGYEGDRWEYFGWYKENLTRGNPRTALVLLNGINVVGPIRNTLDLERRLPLDIVKRIEITSGPGSVLWGSNALLGVINIITHDGRTQPGFHLRLGSGHGEGEQNAVRSHFSYGGSFADEFVHLYLSATWFSSRGPSLTIDHQKIFGALPEPAGDGVSIFQPGPATVQPKARDQILSFNAAFDVGPVSLVWFSGIDLIAREIGPGGSILSQDYRTEPDSRITDDRLITSTDDHFHSLLLRYNKRFLNQRFGVNAQANGVLWRSVQDPFGVFPRSDYLPFGATTILNAPNITRMGLNVDFDYQLPWNNHLLFGGEVFNDAIEDVSLTTFDPFNGPAAGPDSCFEALGFHYRPDLDSQRPCSVTETALKDLNRTIAAAYATNEWRYGRRLAVNAGVRGQFSTTYDPALLVSSGLVVQLSDNIFAKVTYGEGFRPPDFQSTTSSSGIASGISVKANNNLDVERSRAVEVELNARLFENQWPIKQWYIRADYSFSRLTGMITFPAGEYENSGGRNVHSVELLSKLAFYGDHELWTSYYFVDVVDSDTGRLRNIANHILNAGARLSFLDSHLQLSSVLTWRGSMEDLNRTPLLPWTGPPFALDNSNLVQVAATGIEVTEIPSAVLLRLGISGRKLFGRWDISAWVYNALNTQYSDADFFFDDRITSRPQPKPGMSFFVETGVQW
ncbi:MAG TPA: hypothetical protein EYN66_13160 [Myxococcales bacterium]|nr:hypothetical protein [Myxococcales bacterium]